MTEKNKHKPIETKYGILDGRDCIFLDSISFPNGTYELRINGEVNRNFVSKPPNSDVRYLAYELVFTGILALKMIELDSWDFKCESSFDEVLNSDWVANLGGKVSNKHKHIFVQTYDDVFEIVCANYEFKYL